MLGSLHHHFNYLHLLCICSYYLSTVPNILMGYYQLLLQSSCLILFKLHFHTEACFLLFLFFNIKQHFLNIKQHFIITNSKTVHLFLLPFPHLFQIAKFCLLSTPIYCHKSNILTNTLSRS